MNRQLASADLYGETAIMLSVRSGSAAVFGSVIGCLPEDQVWIDWSIYPCVLVLRRTKGDQIVCSVARTMSAFHRGLTRPGLLDGERVGVIRGATIWFLAPAFSRKENILPSFSLRT